MPGVELVAVVDTNRARAEEIATAHGTSPLGDARELAGKVDAVTIAVPTEMHRDIALPFLSAGVPVLVEKPMARSLAEADDMIAAAAKAGGASPWATPSDSIRPSRSRGRSWPTHASSKSTGSACFPSAASTSTSSST